ncbi:MAG: 6-phosphogluconolactonase [Chlamydiae bacterium]|nr:6-phosphogluconolactonase [Chlamydiota bacterium]
MKPPYHFDKRRKLALPGDAEETLAFAVENWIEIAEESIQDHSFFAVALSGGSTPKKIFQELVRKKERVDWEHVYLFWSDERNVVPSSEESNYHMAMEEGGLKNLPIPNNQIFRMVAEEDLENNALAYEKLILEKLGTHPFDLVMLGMGDDGHTASLFPHTKALSEEHRLVVPNFVPQKNTWRMTFTYTCINRARHISIYVMGAAKSEVLEQVLISPLNPETYPSQKIGTERSPALWIVDTTAGAVLAAHLP